MKANADPIFGYVINYYKENKDYLSFVKLSYVYADALQGIDKMDDAISILEEAINFGANIVGNDNKYVIKAMKMYKLALEKSGQIQKSREISKNIKVLEEKFGKNETIESLVEEADKMDRLGETEESEIIYRKIISRSSELMGEAHPQTLEFILKHAALLLYLNRTHDALEQLERGSNRLHEWSENEIRDIFYNKGRRDLIVNQSKWLDIILSTSLQRPSNHATDLAARIAMRWKYRVTEEDVELERLVRHNRAPDIILHDIMIDNLRKRLSYAFHNKKSYIELSNYLDYSYWSVRKSLFKKVDFLQKNIPKQLSNNLKEGEVLIEFQQYTLYYIPYGLFAQNCIAAIIIQPNKDPIVYDAGETDKLIKLVNDMNSGSSRARVDLYAILFGPAAEHLRAANTVFIAPDGPLWDMSPAVLQADAESNFWLKDKSLRILSTGRDLLSEPSSNPAVGVVAIGGVDFGAPKTADAQPSTRLVDSSPAALMRNGREALSPLSPLTYSEGEASYLENLYAGEAGPVTALYGAAATEAALKRLPKPPKVLHLATHGDYRALEKIPDQPEVMSWVALAGANRGLQGGLDADGEDGLLTALEVAGLPLEGTELVVLSACLTGAGYQDYAEGLIGLTRAFRIAGARRVLAALRSVPDDLTADFMIAFHRQWLADGMKDAHESLRRVQLTYADDPDPKKRDPAFWGAFVMIGP